MIHCLSEENKTMAQQTNSFTIAHYLLLAVVVILCVFLVSWALISGHNTATSYVSDDGAEIPTPQITTKISPCAQQMTNAVAQMWAYNYDVVPQKYTDMIYEYAQEEITTPTTGYCNNTRFSCNTGQTRAQCDPCALNSARARAMEAHIKDAVAQNCD